ncbi:hypothetical protein V5O48_011317 [Marasmius crinis-equi]|uniref:Phosphatidate phosphatase APP1 catalytic domain-containing protein n=1 Tax=Marasmius crinis-equi TaxID=585013 RepID=A0ABR3F5Z1_9AGAR
MKLSFPTLPLFSLALFHAAASAADCDPSSFSEVLLFDSPAYQDPANAQDTIVNVQSYVFLRQLDIDGLTTLVNGALQKVGMDVPQQLLNRALDRLKLFAAVGLPGQEVTLTVPGCSQPATLPRTDLINAGMVTGAVSVGQCASADGNLYNADIQGVNSLTPNVTIFSSRPDGFGVISDIDDTVKVSNSLDNAKFIQSTLFDDPTPVPGMPEVYASLAKSLNDPQFIYISASPYQLYPFLRDFIASAYSQSRGPLFLVNYTTTDFKNLLDSVTSTEPGTDDGSSTLNYKTSQIARVQAMYPGKSFLTVGDSTQKDPEAYAQAFKTYGGDFIRCIWVHLVDGADNSDARFAAAFEGVPQERVRYFKDSDIPALANVDVAGGQC